MLRQIQRNHGFNVCGLCGRRLAALVFMGQWGWRQRFEQIIAGGAMPIISDTIGPRGIIAGGAMPKIGPKGIHSRRSDANDRTMARLIRFCEAEAPWGGERGAIGAHCVIAGWSAIGMSTADVEFPILKSRIHEFG